MELCHSSKSSVLELYSDLAIMYFKDRKDAGYELAKKLKNYRHDRVAVLALGHGGYLVGRRIAHDLNCPISVLYSEEITAPGDASTVIGEVDQSGGLTYNSNLSSGQLEEFVNEFHNYIDQERLKLVHKLNSMSAPEIKADPEHLRNHKIIVVVDGAKDGAIFDATLSFLKAVSVDKVVAAIPVASTNAVDKLHMLFDELHCLHVTPNFISVDHYFEDETEFENLQFSTFNT